MGRIISLSVFLLLFFAEGHAIYPPAFPTRHPLPTSLPPYTTEAPPTLASPPTLPPGDGLGVQPGVGLKHPALADPQPKPFIPPQQAYSPLLPKRRLSPMQSESHDYLMGRPQPQVNPPGPEVNPAYGDYSIAPSL